MRSDTLTSALLAGGFAGLAGTTAMMAFRTFDEKYAPKTLPKAKEDPGKFVVEQMERATHSNGKLPKSLEKAGAMSMHIGYGVLPGILFALLRGRRRHSVLLEGAAVGTAVYLIGYAGWLPLLGLTRPAWKQSLPEIAGETMRHIAYGVATAAAYEVVHG
jgi:uncharacterized membrane protein YagU involved in acid resistance